MLRTERLNGPSLGLSDGTPTVLLTVTSEPTAFYLYLPYVRPGVPFRGSHSLLSRIYLRWPQGTSDLQFVLEANVDWRFSQRQNNQRS